MVLHLLKKVRWHISCIRTSELADFGLRCHGAARHIGSVPRNSSQVSSKPIVCLHFLSASPDSAVALIWLDTLSSFTFFSILPSTPHFYNTIFLSSTYAFQFFPHRNNIVQGDFPLILVCFRLLPSVSTDQSDLQPLMRAKMSTHFAFSFGVGGVFTFSFSLGRPATALAPTNHQGY